MIKMFTKKRNKKGFTLIELVVVVAILGILAAIAIPRFTDVRTNAQTEANKATARTIASAVTIAQANLNKAQPTADEINANLNGIKVAVKAAAANGGWAVQYSGATSAFQVSLDATVLITP